MDIEVKLNTSQNLEGLSTRRIKGVGEGFKGFRINGYTRMCRDKVSGLFGVIGFGGIKVLGCFEVRVWGYLPPGHPWTSLCNCHYRV